MSSGPLVLHTDVLQDAVVFEMRPLRQSSGRAAGAGHGKDGMELIPDGLRARRHKSVRTIIALMLREMSTSYGRSAGGYLWAVLEPIGVIVILSFGFSLLLRAPAVGDNFPLFYASGYLPFALYLNVSNKVATSIRFSKPLLAYPAVTFMDAILARLLLESLTQVMVFAVVVTGIHLIFDLRSAIDVPVLVLALALAAGLGLGIGALNCYLMNTFGVWERVWSIINRPMFLLSGVFFTYEAMPAFARDYLWFNPVLQVVGLTRDGIFVTYDAGYVSVAYIAGIAMVCGVFGLLLLYRHNKTLMNA